MKSISEIINQYLDKKGITKKALADMMNDTPQNFGKKLRKQDLDCGFDLKSLGIIDATDIKTKFPAI